MALTEVEEFLALVHPTPSIRPGPTRRSSTGSTRSGSGRSTRRPIRPGRRRCRSRSRRPPTGPSSAGRSGYVRGSAEKRHNVLEIAAWVVTVSDGKLRRVEAFSSWSAADEAADSAPAAGRASAPRRGLQLCGACGRAASPSASAASAQASLLLRSTGVGGMSELRTPPDPARALGRRHRRQRLADRRAAARRCHRHAGPAARLQRPAHGDARPGDRAARLRADRRQEFLKPY